MVGLAGFIIYTLFIIVVSALAGWLYGWSIGRLERCALRREIGDLTTKVNGLTEINTHLSSKKNIESKDALIG